MASICIDTVVTLVGFAILLQLLLYIGLRE